MSPKRNTKLCGKRFRNSKASGPSVLKWKKAGCVENKRFGHTQPKSVLFATEVRDCV
ncbi:hypothetical protein [Holospora obtusa]|uniref:hypothetical protein n=1 Tax=Holospora obtusa TaxID=49893 RepID=UPI00041E1438|nr:hypothetical protein [Holospora obtusa]